MARRLASIGRCVLATGRLTVVPGVRRLDEPGLVEVRGMDPEDDPGPTVGQDLLEVRECFCTTHFAIGQT